MKVLDIVVLGLSLSSSWGNGHATTWRALLRGLQKGGHRTLFLERDVPWYAAHRDLPSPDFCDFALYPDLNALQAHADRIARADAVIVGSYVPEGAEVLDHVLSTTGGKTAFYDIDTPVTLAALARGDCAYLNPAQIPRLDLYLSFTGGPALDTLQTDYGARAPRALFCAVDEDHYRPTDLPIRWDLGYLGTYSPDRQPALDRLLLEPARRLPHQRFVVAGPQYPADIPWPANVERVEHLSPAEHPAFYGSQRYTLNITRADMIALGHSPSVRLFEAAACATPLISDRWQGLHDLFPEGDAILTAETTDDVVSILEHDTRQHRHTRAAHARDIVLARHTGRARAVALATLLQGSALDPLGASAPRPA